jgi:hypothetical protein
MHPFLILASFLGMVPALAINPRSTPQEEPAQGHIIYYFPNSTRVESIAVRSSGDLLVAIATTPELYLTSPTSSTLLHAFPASSPSWALPNTTRPLLHNSREPLPDTPNRPRTRILQHLFRESPEFQPHHHHQRLDPRNDSPDFRGSSQRSEHALLLF